MNSSRVSVSVSISGTYTCINWRSRGEVAGSPACEPRRPCSDQKPLCCASMWCIPKTPNRMAAEYAYAVRSA
jgi:hypothetical protein